MKFVSSSSNGAWSWKKHGSRHIQSQIINHQSLAITPAQISVMFWITDDDCCGGDLCPATISFQINWNFWNRGISSTSLNPILARCQSYTFFSLLHACQIFHIIFKTRDHSPTPAYMWLKITPFRSEWYVIVLLTHWVLYLVGTPKQWVCIKKHDIHFMHAV